MLPLTDFNFRVTSYLHYTMASFNPQPEEITQLLAAYNNGDQQALEQAFPLVYNELRRLAAGYLRREREDHTLQPTALVHEAYLRLLGQAVNWQNRAHFLGVAAQMMRRILVDHARQHQAEKRGSGGVTIALDDVDAINLSAERAIDLIALDDALFAGLSVEETAKVPGISSATFVRQWKTTRAWLYREITKEASND